MMILAPSPAFVPGIGELTPSWTGGLPPLREIPRIGGLAFPLGGLSGLPHGYCSAYGLSRGDCGSRREPGGGRPVIRCSEAPHGSLAHPDRLHCLLPRVAGVEWALVAEIGDYEDFEDDDFEDFDEDFDDDFEEEFEDEYSFDEEGDVDEEELGGDEDVDEADFGNEDPEFEEPDADVPGPAGPTVDEDEGGFEAFEEED